jgi:phenylalanyl-tRNA synthetase beta chain
LFDVYRPKVADGQNEKSLAVRLVLNRDDATLTDEAIESTMSAVLKSLTERVGARLRA